MPETITVEIPYTVDSGEKLVNETFGPNNIRRSRTGSDDRKPMTVQNGRLFGDRLSLDEQGFVFVAHPTQVADFFDAEQLKSVYYPEVEQLIRRESGASRGVVFYKTLSPCCRRTTTTRSGPDPTGCGKFFPMKRTSYSSTALRSFRSGARSISRSGPIRLLSPMPRAWPWTICSSPNDAIRTASGKPTV
jgi:hypothetical protein